MIHFRNDYNDIAHPLILKKLNEVTHEKNIGYGLDVHSENAIKKIQSLIKIPVYVHLMMGGTSTNKTVISHLLKPYEAILSADTGHIEVHETGAIESSGHKIISIPTTMGKLNPELIETYYMKHTDEHMVKPKLVYLSNATETGFIYTKKELKEIYDLCQKLNLYLYLDGARLGVALTAKENDLTFDDLAQLTDVFYIGGTKNGALLGEAVVTRHSWIDEYFRYSIKQNGGLMAKGYILGIQFETLFDDQLFFEIGHHANAMAKALITGLKKLDIPFNETPTNQQFITLPNEVVIKLSTKYTFEIWQNLGQNQMIRLVTTYRTTQEDIKELIADLQK